MKPFLHREDRVWWVAGLVAVLVVISLGFLFSIRSDSDQPQPRPVSTTRGSEIGLTRLVRTSESNLVAAEAEFFDPTPLFLPTEWNSDQNVLPASILRDPGQMFQDFPSRLIFTDEGLGLQFPRIAQAPNDPVDTIPILDTNASFSGMGRGEISPPNLPERGGFLEVRLAGNGQRVMAEVLPTMALPMGNWHPLELIGVVGAAGLIGDLSMVESSGVDEIDTTIRDYLVKSVHIGERLNPGFYRILVGP